MNWVEVNGAGWRLECAGWSRMELGGAGWRLVHGLVIPLRNSYLIAKTICAPLLSPFFSLFSV